VTRPTILAPGLVFAVAIVAYVSTIGDYFVQDDFGVVWLLSQKPATAFPGWFVSTWMDNIWGYTPDEVRPFPALSYQLAGLGGAGIPAANHAINIAFHVGTALLVLALARRAAGLELPAATFAAVLFVLLPNQAETVAWITGRVDSMPALFYLASFLAYVRWRAEGGPRRYWWSVFWCFVALFSKQNTITLGPALVLYDVIVARRPLTVTWGWLRPYVPFGVLTAGYLLLRYALFGEFARESALTLTRMSAFMGEVASHAVRVVAGGDTIRSIGGAAIAIAAAAFLAAWLIGTSRAGRKSGATARTALYFGVVWTALGLAPAVVSSYMSPRHAYLASVGWALTAGIAFDVLWHARTPRRARWAVGVGAATLLLAYAVQLHLRVVDWHGRAAISRKATADLDRVAASAPDGTLIIAGVPSRSWAFALPFAARPPFARTDLTRRVSVVSDSSLHCCAADQWESTTRSNLQKWLSHPGRPPLIAMYWHPVTGQLTRLSDADDPSLRSVIGQFLQTGTRAALDANITRLLNEFVALHGAALRDSPTGDDEAGSNRR
jgi:hypothetical protein